MMRLYDYSKESDIRICYISRFMEAFAGGEKCNMRVQSYAGVSYSV